MVSQTHIRTARCTIHIMAAARQEEELLAARVRSIVPVADYQALLCVDPGGEESKLKFAVFIAKYTGTVTGRVLTDTMEEILQHIEDPYYMARLSDDYRSGQLADDDVRSAEAK